MSLFFPSISYRAVQGICSINTLKKPAPNKAVHTWSGKSLKLCSLPLLRITPEFVGENIIVRLRGGHRGR